MKKPLTNVHIALALLAAICWLIPTTAVAASQVKVTGGGTGTFDADLDEDGDIDGVIIRDGGFAKGHSECLMAGNADILGLPLMAVEGKVTAGSVNGDGATFSGIATVNLGNGQLFIGVPFTVSVTAGGAGVGTLQLTVIGAFDGVPGDISSGNGNYDLPLEVVNTGQISIH